MAAGDSSITICAQATRRLGGKAFSAFTDDVTGAGLCGDIYPTLRDSILGSYDWHFLHSKAQLSKEATGPVSGWQEQYTLKADRLHDAPYRVYNTSTVNAKPLTSGWEIIGDKLMTNEAEIWVDYAHTTDEGLWPRYFTELMVNVVMAEIAIHVTDQENIATRLQIKVYGQDGNGGMLQRARTRNSQDNPVRIIEDFSLIDARHGSV